MLLGAMERYRKTVKVSKDVQQTSDLKMLKKAFGGLISYKLERELMLQLAPV